MKKDLIKLNNSLKKIFKILGLLTVREIYLLGKNLYGVFVHPYLTFLKIIEKEDFSQKVLILGMPLGIWLGWILILLVSRFFIFGKLEFGWMARVSFGLISVVSFLLLGMFFCFFLEVNKRRRRDE